MTAFSTRRSTRMLQLLRAVKGHERSCPWVRTDFRFTPDFGRSRTGSTTSVQCQKRSRSLIRSGGRRDGKSSLVPVA
jgi:hypothetical protein